MQTDKDIAKRLTSENPAISHLLPGDIEAYRVKLIDTYHQVNNHGKLMDGYFFGYVGADGVISLIPVVGDVVSGLTTLWVLSKASQVRMPLGDRLFIFGLGAVDVGIGMTPVVGDVADFIFRAHIWNAQRVAVHIETQLAQIEAAQQRLANVGTVTEDHPTLTHLRDALFRGGKTKKEIWVRLAVIGVICAAFLGYCAHERQLRNERIIECQRNNGWLCQWRY